jgi:hypothetical protein
MAQEGGTIFSDHDTQVLLQYLSCQASDVPCPLCNKTIRPRVRKKEGEGDDTKRFRGEKARRRDHLRKCHQLLFCEHCMGRFPKSELAQHMLRCRADGGMYCRVLKPPCVFAARVAARVRANTPRCARAEINLM